MTSFLISLSDARVTLTGRRALDGITWSLSPGEHWAVLGSNGAGKSTFLRLLRGEQWPDQRLDSPPQVLWNLDNCVQYTPIGIRERLPLISAETQERYLRRNWRVSVEQAVLSGFQDSPYSYRPPTAEQQAAAENALELLDLCGLRDENILELSTGQARKALIARALAVNPRVLLLDEVLEGLDPQSWREILSAIDAFAEKGTQILFATHRLDELPACLNRALWLDSGKLVWQGNMADAPAAALGNIGPGPDEDRLRALWSGAPECGNAPLLRLRLVNVVLEGRTVLKDIDWTIEPGCHWAVAGPNGSGKTTLLRLLAGELPAAAGGFVERFGLAEPVPVETLRQLVGRVSAELQASMGPGLGYDLPALVFVATGFHGSIGLHRGLSQDQLHEAGRWRDFVGLYPLAERPIHEISYGQMRRLLLARSLVHSPRLLLLDEPFSGLDSPSREAFLQALRAAAGLTTLVCVSHHQTEIIPEIQNLLVLDQGRIAFKGSIENWPA